jgi:2-isopropylmalate synthase
MIAGGERVEGTLFGNGERTGNVDLVTIALNLFTQGIDPGLDLRNIPRIAEIVEQCTEMRLHPRHPYAGELVFTAFSGSHQDAIRKGIYALGKTDGRKWEVPYVPIDTLDIGREFEGIIRINSQSGKGGIAFILEQEFGCHLPKEMHPEFSAVVQRISDRDGDELSPQGIWEIFSRTYLTLTEPYELISFAAKQPHSTQSSCEATVTMRVRGEVRELTGIGNGPLDACRHALLVAGAPSFRVVNYTEHARSAGSDAEAVAFVQIETSDSRFIWGASIHPNLELSSLKAVVSAVNRAAK